MQLTKVKAVNLLRGLGYGEKIADQSAKRLAVRLNGLQEKAADLQCDEKHQATFDKVINALEKGEAIEVLEEAETAAPAAPKKHKENGHADKPTDKKSNKDGKDKKKTAPDKKTSNKDGQKPGVVAFIVEQFKKASAKNPLTKTECLERCVKQFPDKAPDGMKKTILNQVSCFIKRANLDLRNSKKEGDTEKSYWITK